MFGASFEVRQLLPPLPPSLLQHFFALSTGVYASTFYLEDQLDYHTLGFLSALSFQENVVFIASEKSRDNVN